MNELRVFATCQSTSSPAAQFDGIIIRFSGVSVDVEKYQSHVQFLLQAGDARELRAAAKELTARLGDAAIGEAGSLVELVAGRLRSKGLMLATAESCTGGLIASMITSEPASDFFAGGAVTYTNEAKCTILGVSLDTLTEFGAVSEPVACAMARGIASKLNAAVGIGVTGIAGPTGGTPAKPVGLVYWAVYAGGASHVQHAVFSGNRMQVQRAAAEAALISACLVLRR